MSVSIQYEYDVALSYASEDVVYVEAVAEALRRQSVKVFFDRFQDIEIDLLGRNLVDELSKVYQYKARLCVLFISHAYSRKGGLNFEARHGATCMVSPKWELTTRT